MLIQFKNGMAGEEGKTIAVNPAHIVSVEESFEGETRIWTVAGREIIIAATVAAVLSSLPQPSNG